MPEGVKLPGDTGLPTGKLPCETHVKQEDEMADQNTGAQNQQTQQQSTEGQQQGAAAAPQTQSQQGFSFDYEKLAQIISGRTSTAEDSALKGYFKQQGLSQQEVEQAIASFKKQKAASTPDVSAMQAQLTEAQEQAKKAQIESAATAQAVGLGIDAKTIPYVLKMADLSRAVGTDGKINAEEVKKAIQKVLEDVPALKPSNAQSSGFVQVGASGGKEQQTNEDALKKAFGL